MCKVQGQLFLPSGTTLRCYGTDSTCFSTPSVKVYDYGSDGYFEGNAATLNSYYFTSLNLIVPIDQTTIIPQLGVHVNLVQVMHRLYMWYNYI